MLLLLLLLLLLLRSRKRENNRNEEEEEVRSNKIEEEEEESAMECHGLQTYINTRHSTFSHLFCQYTFCPCGVDMGWFCSFSDKSFSRKDSNAKALDFQTSQY